MMGAARFREIRSAAAGDLAFTVIVPSYRRTQDLARCLAALAVQIRPADEIVGIAQRVDEETVAVFRKYMARIAQLQLVLVERPGVIHALNEGIASSRGEIIVMTDDDAEADPDWLKRIEEWFLKDPRIGAVGGRDRLQYPGFPHLSDPPPVKEVGKVTWYGALRGNHHCPTVQPVEVDVLKGVNLAVRRTALDPEGFGHALRGAGAQVGWELEVCMRVKALGFRLIFDPDVSVKHFASKRPAGLERTKIENYEGIAARDAAFNYGYLHAKWFSPLQLCGAFLSGMSRGTRRFPGFLAIVKYCMLGEFAIVNRFANQFPASIAGYKAGFNDRRAGRHAS